MNLRIVGLCSLAAVLVAGCGDKKKGSGNLDCPAPVGTVFDTDGDLLTNIQEEALGTNPGRADSDGDGFGDYVEHKAGTDPLSSSSTPSGAAATVTQIANASELIGGPAAQGRVGDWLLQNDRIRAIVQAPGAEQMQVGSYGGNLVDVDVIRGPGDPGNDELGMVVPFISLGATSRPTEAVVINDGSDGGPAVLRVCGGTDVLEYIDVSATFDLLGLAVDFDSNREYDFGVSNDYVLAPGSDVVEIVTTIGNRGPTAGVVVGDILESGSMQEIFATNVQGWGEAGFDTLLNYNPPTQYIGMVGGAAGTASTWGYLPDAQPNASVTISGVTVFLEGFPDLFSVIGTNPDEDEPHDGLYRVRKGGRFSWHRGVKVTDGSAGLGPLVDEHFRRQNAAAATYSGTVADGNGAPIEGARIAFLTVGTAEADRNPIATVESDANGDYAVTLPPGSYYMAADKPGRAAPTYASGTPASIQTRLSANTLDVVQVSLQDGAALPDITFGQPATLQVTVTDIDTGLPAPSRITVVGTDPTPRDTIFRDDYHAGSASAVAWDYRVDGVATLEVEPGTYTVYASRGLEWSLAEAQVVLTAGNTTTQALQIGQVVDTPGWISADFHVHMGNSPDARSSAERRILGAVGEGLDVMALTDHDYVSDLAPLIQAMGLSTATSAVPGDEITPWNYGHFIAWPLTPDPTKVDGGAYKWAGGAGVFTNKSPREIFEEIDAAHAGTQISQVNHPRGFAGQSHYTVIQLDTLTLQTKRDASYFRIPPIDGATADDTRMFYPDIDAQEVLNGAKDISADYPEMNDLFTFLSHGLPIVGMGNSDTHKDFGDPVGIPRNYVKVQDDAPANMNTPAAYEALAVAVDAGHVTFTSGPFLEVTVTGTTSGGPGDLVTANAGDVTVDVTLTAPDWVEVDTLEIFMNTPNTIAPSDAENATAPTPQYSQAITLTPVTLANTLVQNTGAWSIPMTLPAGDDAWIVVTVKGSTAARSLFPVVPKGSSTTTGPRAFAFANAVWVDNDGNGVFDPPGPTVTSAYQRPQPEAVRRFDAPKAITPDIRAQFERLLRDAHKH